MRLLWTLFTSLMVLCLFCAPAPAQSSSPSASQYEPGTPCTPDSPGVYCAQSLDSATEDIADNAARGTDAVNGAMDGAVEGPTSASGSASPEAVLSSETSASPEGASSSGPDGASTGGGSGSITELPETGGGPLGALVLGLSLVALGLLARETAGR